RHKDAVGRVDPDLFDAVVIEERLKRPVADDRRHHVTRGLSLIIEQRMCAAESPLAVALHLVTHETLRRGAVRAQVDAFAPHALAHPIGDEGYRGGHARIMPTTGDFSCQLSTGGG